jgi:hypothetical protein
MDQVALALREFTERVNEARAQGVASADAIERARDQFRSVLGDSRNPNAAAMVHNSDTAAQRLREADQILLEAIDRIRRYAADLGIDLGGPTTASGSLATVTPSTTSTADETAPVTFSGYPFNVPHPINWSDLHHVCYGDPDDEEKGRHLYGTGRPEKTEFPPDWDDEKVAEALTAVAGHPTEVDERVNGNWYATGTHDGVRVTAVVRRDGSIAAGWPDSGPGVHRNPPSRRR